MKSKIYASYAIVFTLVFILVVSACFLHVPEASGRVEPPNLQVNSAANKLTFSWDPIPEAKSYQVFFQPGNIPTPEPGEGLFPYADVITATELEMTNLIPSQTYTFWARAINNQDAIISNYAKITGVPLWASLNLTRDIPQDAAIFTQYKLRWDEVFSATEYHIYYTTGIIADDTPPNGLTPIEEDSLIADAGYITYTLSGLAQGTAYTVWVKSYNSYGESAYEKTSFTTLGLGSPDIAIKTGNTRLLVEWDAVTGASGYEVVWHTDNSTGAIPPITPLGSATTSGTSYLIGGNGITQIETPLTNETTYYVWVKSTAGATASDYDNDQGIPTEGGSILPPVKQENCHLYDPVLQVDCDFS